MYEFKVHFQGASTRNGMVPVHQNLPAGQAGLPDYETVDRIAYYSLFTGAGGRLRTKNIVERKEYTACQRIQTNTQTNGVLYIL